MNYYKIIFFLLAFQAYSLYSQQLVPPIHNYYSTVYNAASQNWDIDVDKDGVIYIANNQGLLSFDGQSWELFPLPDGGIIRSVFVHKNKIFTGSYKEFGYWKKDNTGKYFYTTLVPQLEKYALQSEEFWEILAFEGDIYFRSFGAIYKYDYNTITRVQNVVSNKMIVYQNKLLVAVRKNGLFNLNNKNELEKLPNLEILNGEVVIDMAIQGNDLIMGTRKKIFIYDGESSRLYGDSRLQEELKRSELNKILALENERLLFGTINNGLINYNKEKKSYTIFNRNNGLQNNTILDIIEKDGNVWLGLDNGIDRIEIDSPVEFYTDDTGELGAVYDLEFYKNNMYLASNTGVYTFDNNQLKIIDGAEGHTWNLKILKDTLFVNHNTGSYYLFNDKLIPIETTTGSFEIYDIPSVANEYLISSYTGIRNFDRKQDSVYTIESLNFPVKNIVFENDHTFWAVHPYEGLYRVGMSENYKETKFIDRIKIPDGGKSINTDIFKINNRLAIFNGKQWFKYNLFKDSVEIFEELQAMQKHKMLLKSDDSYWFSHTVDNSLKFTDFDNHNIVFSLSNLNNRLVKNYEKILKKDSLFYIALNNGFARVDLAKFINNLADLQISKPTVNGFLDSERRYPLVRKPVAPYKTSRNLKIFTSLPVSDATGLRYRLKGEDTLSGKVNNGVINLKNLKHGDYELQLLAIGPQAKIAKKSFFNFSIAPPWYLSFFMKLVYFLILVSVVILVYRFNQIKLKKQQLFLEEKFEKEHQERVNNLEKENLVNQINLKRKELANTTMIAAKKNEMLMEVQNELNREDTKFANQYKKKHLLKKINQAIKNKEEWKVFETNFNELHEDFFKDLLDNYPKLSNKDLKLCSYLKMNLASKEIAPLMGISLRGVEIQRYRLRKKMGLDKSTNLNNFFIKNF